MRRILNAAAAFAVLVAGGFTASAGHHSSSCCKPAPTYCKPAPKCHHAKRSCGLLGLPKLELPKLQLPKLDLFGCSKRTHRCCKPAPPTCSGGKGYGEETKAPKVEDAPPPPYEDKAPAPAPPKEGTKAEPVKKAAPATAAPPKA